MKCLTVALFVFFLSINCFAQGHKAPRASAKQIDTLYYFDPVSTISLFAYNPKPDISDSLSRLNHELQLGAIQHFGNRMKLAGMVQISDTVQNRHIREEVLLLMYNARYGTYAENMPASVHLIDSVMDAAGYRYVLLLSDFGFLRTRQNYKEAKARARAETVSTLLFITSTAVKMGAGCEAMIYDAKENKTFFYKYKYYDLEDDPASDPVNASGELERFQYLFGGFFWQKPW